MFGGLGGVECVWEEGMRVCGGVRVRVGQGYTSRGKCDSQHDFKNHFYDKMHLIDILVRRRIVTL